MTDLHFKHPKGKKESPSDRMAANLTFATLLLEKKWAKVIKVGEPYLQELFKAAQPDLARIAQFACSIGTAYLELGKGDKATEYANLGLTHQPKHVRCLVLKSRIQPDTGLEFLLDAYRADPKDVEVLRFLSRKLNAETEAQVHASVTKIFTERKTEAAAAKAKAKASSPGKAAKVAEAVAAPAVVAEPAAAEPAAAPAEAVPADEPVAVAVGAEEDKKDAAAAAAASATPAKAHTASNATTSSKRKGKQAKKPAESKASEPKTAESKQEPAESKRTESKAAADDWTKDSMLAVIQEECVAVARLCSDIEDMPKQLIEWMGVFGSGTHGAFSNYALSTSILAEMVQMSLELPLRASGGDPGKNQFGGEDTEGTRTLMVALLLFLRMSVTELDEKAAQHTDALKMLRVLHKGRREIAVPLSQFAPLLRPAFDVVKTAIAAFKALPKGNKGQEQMRKFWTSVRPAGGSAGTAGAAP